MIVALSGYGGAGKDEVGRVLVESFGFERRSFADPLKEIARRIGWDGAKDDFGRRLLQDLGLGARDVLGEAVWVEPVMRSMHPARDYVLTDCRFVNEAQAVKSLGGVVVRVNRRGHGPVNGHPSETALDRWPFDAVIDNTGTLADLERATCRLAHHLLGLAVVLPFRSKESA